MNGIIAGAELLQAIAEDREIQHALKHHKDKLGFMGHVTMDHMRAGKLLCRQSGKNTFTTEGMAKLLNILFHDISKAAANIWYVGIFKNNITPALADTSAKLGSGNAYGECQDADYDSPLTNRPSYATEDTTTAVISNVNSKAHFVMNASITVYGAFLADAAAKTASSGVLMCAKRFGTPRAVINDDEIYVTYQITSTTS
ncbi:MAG: hypothetical protein H8D87_20220 [Deltaproteobacteria bacterium]|uniref:hypothetical protein n=1 Tax=Desulfobacula sp. TaxID=2593537 RepID=UPI001993C326|nr:hypothetical protein [Candidatus Desulfobacula maris]MBL6992282.1 hypothetical protein [Desulfobacula sp.]